MSNRPRHAVAPAESKSHLSMPVSSSTSAFPIRGHFRKKENYGLCCAATRLGAQGMAIVLMVVDVLMVFGEASEGVYGHATPIQSNYSPTSLMRHGQSYLWLYLATVPAPETRPNRFSPGRPCTYINCKTLQVVIMGLDLDGLSFRNMRCPCHGGIDHDE